MLFYMFSFMFSNCNNNVVGMKVIYRFQKWKTFIIIIVILLFYNNDVVVFTVLRILYCRSIAKSYYILLLCCYIISYFILYQSDNKVNLNKKLLGLIYC